MKTVLPRVPTPRQVRLALTLVLVLVLSALGGLLVTDRPGLTTEYFSLVEPWKGSPIHTAIGEPRLDSDSRLQDILLTKAVFSVRWSGWWHVAKSGRHRFVLDADDGGYIRIDGEVVVNSRTTAQKKPWAGRTKLLPGLHRVEIGYYQTHGKSNLGIQWLPPGKGDREPTTLPVADLFAQRPVALRQALRHSLASWPRTYRQFLGAAFLLAALLLLRVLAAPLGKPMESLRDRISRFDQRGVRAGLLLALFAFAFFASLPFTGTVRGGDDTAYLAAATFGEKAWFFNRYAHVYLLKAFVTLSGGHPLAAVRVWWSFVFAATVASLAIAVRSVGPGLQLRTLTATLFVLLAQTSLLGMIGAGFADYSAMMFVTAAVATYLHWIARDSNRPPPRFEWHALAIGVLTIAAFRSKEVGAILLLLPILFLLENGQLDLRRFMRKITFWAAGGAIVLFVLALLDGWILGDFLFTFDGGRFERSGSMNFPEGLKLRKDSSSWLRVMWHSGAHPASLAMRNLWVGVVAAAIAAGLRRRRIEIRLLHFLPIAFLLALIALYVRMPHPFSSRMLIPILPTASLMTGLLLYHAGLEEITWKRLTAPRVLLPAGLAVAAITLVAIPYRMGTLAAADFLPVATLARFGWKPDVFLTGTVLPAVVLVAMSFLALAVASRRARVVALAVACLAFFGLGFEFNRTALERHLAAQKGQLLLYPWRAFADELEAARPNTVVLSTDLQANYGMSGATRSTLAALALGRRDVHVELSRQLPTDADVAIASRFVYSQWLRQAPALATTAKMNPAGLLVFMRPKDALQEGSVSAGQ